jgi:DNA-binding PadR family transcriptional regulator
MSIKHALLGILAREPGHGYDLKRAFDEKLGDFWELNVGQIYTTLQRMEDEGWVQNTPVPQDDRPDKKVYQITSEGLEEFRAWRTRPVKPAPRPLRDELFLKILFMEDDDYESVLNLIQMQHNVYMQQMMQVTNRKFQVEQRTRQALSRADSVGERRLIEREHLLQLALLDVALFHAEADIRWSRHIEAKIRELYH